MTVKIYTEERKRKDFDDIPIEELRDMVGWIEPSEGGETWDVSTADGGVFVCQSQEIAYIMAGVEEIRAKLFYNKQ